MQVYLVGGAVRDALLGIPPRERDWVVIGSTPEAMLAQGYVQIGKDFPVFLHPETKEEYALARTERKTGKGYRGFICYASPTVTLEEDLLRRDLTINAIAQADDGTLIDPYGGQADIKHKYLRHVSPAFTEDPLRVLRLARFAARFPDFTIHPDTSECLKQMVKSGELKALSADRVWREFDRALNETNPMQFFNVLTEYHIAPLLFPSLTLNATTLHALENILPLTQNAAIRFAVLLHTSTEENLKTLGDHYPIPKKQEALASLLIRHVKDYTHILSMDPHALYALLKAGDFIRRPERLEFFLLAAHACCTASQPYPSAEGLHLRKALEAAIGADTGKIVASGLQGPALGKAIDSARIQAIDAAISARPPS